MIMGAWGLGRKKLSAKSYVQDGLIAMWDGIENAGWGVHDSSAQGWTNLVTGDVSPLVNSIGSFEDNRFAAGNGGGVNIGLFSGVCALEICVSRHSSNYSIVSPDKDANDSTTISAINMIFVNGVGYVPNKQNAGKRVSFEDYTTPHTIAFVRETPSDGSVVTYGDGIISTGNLYNDYWKVSKGYLAYSSYQSRWSNIDCYCLRLYSRALTADEIAANYAIDKARFNLP